MESGVNSLYIQELLGHSNPKTTGIYGTYNPCWGIVTRAPRNINIGNQEHYRGTQSNRINKLVQHTMGICAIAHTRLLTTIANYYMRNEIRKVGHPRNELIRYLNYHLNKEIQLFSNSHVKQYLKSCLRQSIEYFKLFETASIDISPLLGFYSLLNLAKVETVVRNGNHSIPLADIESKFRSHGASSKSINEIKINISGTFIEFANSNSVRSYPSNVSLDELYKILPDTNLIYEEIYPSQSDLILIKTIEDYMDEIAMIDSNVYLNGLSFPMSQKTLIQPIYQNDFDFVDYHSSQTFMYLKDTSKEYRNFMLVNSDGDYYLSTNKTLKLNEAEIIYLVFLKYSSLVRYKPKNWTEKLDSDEYSIITKILDESVTKFWSIITSQYTNDHKYIL